MIQAASVKRLQSPGRQPCALAFARTVAKFEMDELNNHNPNLKVE